MTGIFIENTGPRIFLFIFRSCQKATAKARIESFCAENGGRRLVHQSPLRSDPSVAASIFKLVLVLDVPFFILVRVFARQSVLLFIHFHLIALRILLVVVVLRVTLHPFDWNAFACNLIDTVDPHADDVTLLSEGLRCNCGCQDSEGRSFHQLNF